VGVGVIFKQDELVTALREGEEKSKEHSAYEYPARYHDMNHQSSRDYPKEKSEAYHEDIDDDAVFKKAAVCHLQHNVHNNNIAEARIEHEGQGHGKSDEYGDDDPACSYAYTARRDGPVFFEGMRPVLVEIENIVEGINGAGHQRKEHKGDYRAGDVSGFEGVTSENERGKDDSVFRPLPYTEAGG